MARPQPRVALAVAALVALAAACAPGSDPVAPIPTEAAPAVTPRSTTSAAPDGGAPAATGAPLPGDAWSPRAAAPIALTEVAVAAFGGQVWVAGGLTSDGRASDAVLVYDPTFDTWSEGSPLPEPVHHSALVAAGDALLLVGGYTGDGFDRPTAAVRRFDVAAGEWTDAPALPAPRAAGAAAFDGQRVVYAGGVGPVGVDAPGLRASAEVLAMQDGRWQRVGALSEAREHLAAAGGDGEVYVLGGRRAGLDTNLATADLVTADGVRAIGALPTPRGGVAAFPAPGGGACLVAGEEPQGTLADVECITADGAVSRLPALGVARHGLGAAVVDGVAYVLLGGREPGLFTSDVVEALRLGAPGRPLEQPSGRP